MYTFRGADRFDLSAGKTAFVVKNPVEASNFSHIAGHIVLIDGVQWKVDAVDRFAIPVIAAGREITLHCSPVAVLAELLPCPHCGSKPFFTYRGEQDDRRYVAMELECCAMMSATISYPAFTKMTEDVIKVELKAKLTESWNTRHVPEVEE